MADLEPSENRALKERIQRELKGREKEVWEFVKASIEDTEGLLDVGDLYVGLHGLHLINGYDDQILDEFLQLLTTEASEFESFEDLLFRRDRRELTASKNEFGILSKRETLIELGFQIFDFYRDGLPREIAIIYLPINEIGIRDEVIKWSGLHGKEIDIDILARKAEELRNQGAIIAAEMTEEAIIAINARSDAAQGNAEDDQR